MMATMASFVGRTIGCGLVACAVLFVGDGDAVADVGTPIVNHMLVDQVAPLPGPGSVTYTPMRSPGDATPAAPAQPIPSPPPVPAVPTYVAPVPVAPAYVAPASAPSPFGLPVYSPLPYAPATPQSSSLPLVNRQSLSRNGEPGAVVADKAAPPRRPGHRFLGVSSDIGIPDGLNVGLVVAPADWMRLGASIGTNSASLDYRGGLSLIPMGWGPSFSLEVGHCNLAATTSLIRTIFSISSWVQTYVQQLGYTYVNAHVGFDYRFTGLTLFVHGGYTYISGTIRAPDSMVVDSSTSTTVTLAQDGNVHAYTLSAKVGLIYMFGGL
jgi:hypothetical protein